MTHAIIAIIAVLLILFSAEYLWRTKRLEGESARKLIHILAGSIAAALPFWLSYHWIAFCSLGVICLSLINSHYHFFKAGLSIKRRTYGDFMFASGIFICTLIHPAPWLFSIAILHVALGDGFAALLGLRFSKRFYKVFGHKKSLFGTITFAVTSFLILAVAINLKNVGYAYSLVPSLLVIPVTTALLENISGYGTDNITVPLAVLGLLSIFRF